MSLVYSEMIKPNGLQSHTNLGIYTRIQRTTPSQHAGQPEGHYLKLETESTICCCWLLKTNPWNGKVAVLLLTQAENVSRCGALFIFLLLNLHVYVRGEGGRWGRDRRVHASWHRCRGLRSTSRGDPHLLYCLDRGRHYPGVGQATALYTNKDSLDSVSCLLAGIYRYTCAILYTGSGIRMQDARFAQQANSPARYNISLFINIMTEH